MLPPNLTTPREVTLYYNALYHELTTSGYAHAFVYPWAGAGAFLVIAYLLLDHRENVVLQRLRIPVFAAVAVFQAWCILYMRARHPAAAFGVGLLSAWGVFWVSCMIGAGDAQSEWRRIEREESHGTGDGDGMVVANGSAMKKLESDDDRSSTPTKTRLYWQSYPTPFLQRLDWVADAFCSFRGVGWNFQTSTVPPLPAPADLAIPKSIQHSKNDIITTSRIGIRRFNNKADLARDTIPKLIIGYLVLDLVKVLMHRDAYFWGYMNAAGPTYLPQYIRGSYMLLKSWRLLISLTAIYTCLWEIFRLGPALFCLILGPKWVGVRGEAWMNPPDMYGSFKCVLDDGLAGWWGGWWHQVFRVAFETHSKALLGRLKIETRSTEGKLTSLAVAFTMSGVLHACGSYTQLGDTRPFLGPMRFFLLQMVGIMVQAQTTTMLRKASVFDGTPKVLRRITNFVFVHIWLYYTAPLLMDDFAKGGVWLFEPVAVSPLRGLGLGAKDDGWFCWWNGIAFWRSGEHWWDTGIAI